MRGIVSGSTPISTIHTIFIHTIFIIHTNFKIPIKINNKTLIFKSISKTIGEGGHFLNLKILYINFDSQYERFENFNRNK